MSDTIMQSTWQTKELGMVTRKGKSVTPESSFSKRHTLFRLEKMEVLLVLFVVVVEKK